MRARGTRLRASSWAPRQPATAAHSNRSFHNDRFAADFAVAPQNLVIIRATPGRSRRGSTLLQSCNERAAFRLGSGGARRAVWSLQVVQTQFRPGARSIKEAMDAWSMARSWSRKIYPAR